MERSIGFRMADLEPINGYNCTKTAISQLKSGFCEKINYKSLLLLGLSIFLNEVFTGSYQTLNGS